MIRTAYLFSCFYFISITFATICLQACTTNRGPAPVRDVGSNAVIQSGYVARPTVTANTSPSNQTRQKLEPGTPYKVQTGDTLYSIAWMYDADVKTLAEQNAINPPYNIFVGQTIRYALPTQISPASEIKPSYTSHKVVSGDTLLVLARQNGMSLSQLAKLNNIKSPYDVRIGQVIRIPDHNKTGSSLNATNSPLIGSNKIQNKERAVDQKYAKQSPNTVVVSKQTDYSGSTKTEINKNLTWRWPTKGVLVSRFNPGEMGNKGIDISGRRGQPVVAAASGRVVYAGNALRGYGNLVIIKHNDDYLSAYAHNDVLRVTEQQVVKAGQIIADMGNSESSKVQLHFEIRYKGQSVDPVRFLPKR